MQTLAPNKTVALGRMLFLDCFVIRNTDCCKAILVTVQAE